MEFKETQSIYLQIADYFCENILKGKWKEGDRVPSVRETAVSIEVNPNTVMRTFMHLQDQGIIYNKRGIGYFVAENAGNIIRNMKKESFINKDLPEFFKTIELLDIDFDTLQKYYKDYKTN